MATVNGKGGLTPVGSLRQADWNGKLRQYPIASGYGTSIYTGDLVTLSSGSIQRAAFNFSAGAATGVFLGCSYTNPTTKQPVWSQYWPASTVASDAVAYVCDDPEAVFELQSDAALTAAALGKNIDLVQTSAGSDTTGKSGMNASGSSIATTNTLRFRVVGLKATPDNGWTDTYPIILVKFNFGFHAQGTATGL